MNDVEMDRCKEGDDRIDEGEDRSDGWMQEGMEG